MDTSLRDEGLWPRIDALVREAEALRQGSRFAAARAKIAEALELAPENSLLRLLAFRIEQDLAESRASPAPPVEPDEATRTLPLPESHGDRGGEREHTGALEPTLQLPLEPAPEAASETFRESVLQIVDERPVRQTEALPRPPAGAAPRRRFDEITLAGLAQVSPLEPAPARPAGRPSSHGVLVAGILIVVASGLAGLWLAHRGTLGPAGPEPLEVEDVGKAALVEGTLVIDALPWARILRVASLDEPPAAEITPPPFTPAVVHLRPGSYRVTLLYPPDGRTAAVDVEVGIGDGAEVRPAFATPRRRDFSGPLHAAAAELFAGRYDSAAELAGAVGAGTPAIRARALLIRAAARAAIYWRGDETEVRWLRGALDDLRECRRLDPSAVPGEELSPRFRELYAPSRPEP